MESNADAKKPQSSATDLFSSAKVVAEAAASAFRHDPGNVDKGNAANAAADLLHSASHYAKLEEKGLGTYVEKAEDFLRGDKPANSSATAAAAGEATQSEKKESGFGDYMGMAQGLMKKQSGEHGSGEEKSEKKESGFGGYMGMAQGLMKKQSGEHGSGEEKSEKKESGFGDYMGMAQGLMKKQSGEHGSGEEKSEKKESGFGDYMEMAQGLIKKHSGEHGSGEEEKKSEGGAGGVGDYMKMAEGFLKKN